MALYEIKNLSFCYPDRKDNALEDISLQIGQGEFILVCGQAGCGKTTLLRMLKPSLAPHGEWAGEILYEGSPVSLLSQRDEAKKIGFVFQNPNAQAVTDKVWHELAFGLESLGLPAQEIRRRVGEMASFFGIEALFRRSTDTLSGGQKQLLALASVMVMQPSVLILDEPTAQLDPIAASEFLSALRRINRELGLTVILAEHRLEDLFPSADRVLIMEECRALVYAPPRLAADILRNADESHPMLSALPSAVRIYSGLDIQDECPLTVKEGRIFLSRHFDEAYMPVIKETTTTKEKAAELKDVWFRYEKDSEDILRGASFSANIGETCAILGGNGAGKTTALNVLSGTLTPYRGKIRVMGRNIREYRGNTLYRNGLACLPQDPQVLFIKDTVLEDFYLFCISIGLTRNEAGDMISSVSQRLNIEKLLSSHPYDLSAGQQQACALAKILLGEPKVLLLDEPTKGLDAFMKQTLGGILMDLKHDGTAVILVTHDVEFAGEYADRCALFFDGEIVSEGAPAEFFMQNSFYTTAASRIARHLYPNAITCGEVVSLAKQHRKQQS